MLRASALARGWRSKTVYPFVDPCLGGIPSRMQLRPLSSANAGADGGERHSHHAAKATSQTDPSSSSPPKKLVLVVAAALIDGQRRVLLARRPPGKAMAGLWEFPGGKVDAGETPEAALARELREELSVEVDEADLSPVAFASHSYDKFHLLMPLYACRRWRGDPSPQEGQELAWASAGELAAFEMPAADIPLIGPVKRAMADV